MATDSKKSSGISNRANLLRGVARTPTLVGVQEPTLATPTIRLTGHADAALRQAFELPTNAHVARHLRLDPSNYSRVHRQRSEVSSQLFARLVIALSGADRQSMDLIEAVDADGNVYRLALSWERPEAAERAA